VNRLPAGLFHHLLKTFCGWRDRQMADGTIEPPPFERAMSL
jgi:hypothetical protein